METKKPLIIRVLELWKALYKYDVLFIITIIKLKFKFATYHSTPNKTKQSTKVMFIHWSTSYITFPR